jgi:hypothetical protein
MASREPIVIISEPLLRTDFSQHVFVSPLAERLAERFDVTVASPSIGEAVQDELRARGVEPRSANVWFPPARYHRDEPYTFAESWLGDAILSTNRRAVERCLRGNPALRLNFSMTVAVPSDIWYIQSQPLSVSLRAIQPNLGTPLRLATQWGLPVIDLLDERRIAHQAASAGRMYTSSKYVAHCYERRGFRVSGQIPVFPFPSDFSATTQKPTRDYALVYLGKETDITAVREMIRLGMPIRLFGGKSAQWVRSALGNELPSNVEMCGYVSHEELCDLYTNALFTAFPFTDESFGLVPVESMACGTPVLTYASQGPGETVVDGFTGWLAYHPIQFLEAARRLFERGYPPGMQSACVERSQWFSLSNVARLWTGIIQAQLDGREPYSSPPAAPLLQVGGHGFLSIRDLVGSA